MSSYSNTIEILKGIEIRNRWERSALNLAIMAMEKSDYVEPVRGKYCPEIDSYDLLCPKCDSFVGELSNEDDDGVYRYKISNNYCGECGQRLELETELNKNIKGICENE